MSFGAFQVSALVTSKAVLASTAVVATQVCTGGQQGMYVANPSTIAAWLAAGSSSIQAAIPTTATPGLGICLPAGQQFTFAVAPGSWLSAASSGNAAVIYATPGNAFG